MIKAIIERLGSGGQQRKPKIAKGTRDFGEEQMLVREEAFSIIRRIFKLHGAKEIGMYALLCICFVKWLTELT